jgi:Replicative DNA helicase
MSKWAEVHLPCPCGTSSNAYSIDHQGDGYCFSCSKPFKNKEKMTEATVSSGDYTYEYLPRRGISAATHEFFGARTRVDADGKPTAVEYGWPNGTTQLRFLDKKDFRFIGDKVSEIGGWPVDKFTPGSARAITITEGLDDAMAVLEMMGKYPVYAVKSASSAVSDCRKDFDYVNSFEKIYLALDDDEPGRKATAQVAAIFGHNKCYHVKLSPFKDPHDYLEAGKGQEFKNAWFNAGKFLPEGIVSSFSDFDEILDNSTKGVGQEWPFPTLTAMTGGLHCGRSYLLSGLEGIGKTELLHATIAHLCEADADANIGVLLWEEPPGDTLKKQAGYYLQKDCHTDDSTATNAEIKAAYRDAFKRPDRVHVVEHYGSEDHDILLSKIRYLVAACQCKYVFFDNITLMGAGRGSNKVDDLDWLSTRLIMLTKELNFVLIFISHENANEETKDCKNISKVADVWINLKRDLKHENDFIRRVIHVTIFKNRQNWKTGPAGRLVYDPETAVLTELTGELPT